MKHTKADIRCATCGFETNDCQSFEQHKCLDISEFEKKLISAAMMADFCDHFCCGMTHERCLATNFQKVLANMGLVIVEK